MDVASKTVYNRAIDKTYSVEVTYFFVSNNYKKLKKWLKSQIGNDGKDWQFHFDWSKVNTRNSCLLRRQNQIHIEVVIEPNQE